MAGAPWVRGPASFTRVSSSRLPVPSTACTRAANGGRRRPAPVGSASTTLTHTTASSGSASDCRAHYASSPRSERSSAW